MTQPAHSRARAKLDAICERLRSGTPINHACALEHVPRRSLYALLDADPDADVMVQAARAEAAERLRSNIVELAQGGVQGANPNVLLHLAERLYPDDYAPPKQRIEQELSVRPLGELDRVEVYARLIEQGALRRGANPDDEREAMARGLLPDVIDGETE